MKNFTKRKMMKKVFEFLFLLQIINCIHIMDKIYIVNFCTECLKFIYIPKIQREFEDVEDVFGNQIIQH